MKSTFRPWLGRRGYNDKTVQSRMSGATRVENYYGNLDEHFDRDQLRTVLDELEYSVEDEHLGKSNPSKIKINGNIRDGLASCKSATNLYCEFRKETTDDEDITSTSSLPTKAVEEAIDDRGQTIGLERDLQVALRGAIEQLDPGLEIIDNGVERSVSSGRIDITARDANGAIVVIELKTGTARRDAIAQVQSYMGDVKEEEPDTEVRGLLIAGDFDKKARAAARMAPTLSLRAYRMNFEFTDADEAPE